MQVKAVNVAVGLALAALAIPSVHAAGFALQNQNGAGTGYAYAGSAAVAEDASTVFFNPAGMSLLPEGTNVSLAGTVLIRSLKYSDAGTAPPVFIPGSPADNGGDAGGTALIPAFYLTRSLTPQLSLGLGVSPTFGNKTEYDNTFIGRYQGYYSEIKTINVNPSLSWKASEQLSLGVGINFAKLEADLRGMVPGVLLPAPLTAPIDYTSRLKGDDTGWGWNVGALWQASPATRVGLTYRSKIDLTVTGSASTGPLSNPAKVDIELPDMASLALVHRLNDHWQVQADYTWTGWSSIPALVVKHRVSNAILTNEKLAFKNSSRFGVGVQYQYTPQLKLRAGIAWDQSPVRSAETRTVRLPDSSRTWFAVGGNYALSKDTSLDFGYAYLHFADAKIHRRTVLGTTPTPQVLDGSFDTHVHILSLQLNHHF